MWLQFKSFNSWLSRSPRDLHLLELHHHPCRPPGQAGFLQCNTACCRSAQKYEAAMSEKQEKWTCSENDYMAFKHSCHHLIPTQKTTKRDIKKKSHHNLIFLITAQEVRVFQKWQLYLQANFFLAPPPHTHTHTHTCIDAPTHRCALTGLYTYTHKAKRVNMNLSSTHHAHSTGTERVNTNTSHTHTPWGHTHTQLLN